MSHYIDRHFVFGTMTEEPQQGTRIISGNKVKEFNGAVRNLANEDVMQIQRHVVGRHAIIQSDDQDTNLKENLERLSPHKFELRRLTIIWGNSEPGGISVLSINLNAFYFPVVFSKKLNPGPVYISGGSKVPYQVGQNFEKETMEMLEQFDPLMRTLPIYQARYVNQTTEQEIISVINEEDNKIMQFLIPLDGHQEDQPVPSWSAVPTVGIGSKSVQYDLYEKLRELPTSKKTPGLLDRFNWVKNYFGFKLGNEIPSDQGRWSDVNDMVSPSMLTSVCAPKSIPLASNTMDKLREQQSFMVRRHCGDHLSICSNTTDEDPMREEDHLYSSLYGTREDSSPKQKTTRVTLTERHARLKLQSALSAIDCSTMCDEKPALAHRRVILSALDQLKPMRSRGSALYMRDLDNHEEFDPVSIPNVSVGLQLADNILDVARRRRTRRRRAGTRRRRSRSRRRRRSRTRQTSRRRGRTSRRNRGDRATRATGGGGSGKKTGAGNGKATTSTTAKPTKDKGSTSKTTTTKDKGSKSTTGKKANGATSSPTTKTNKDKGGTSTTTSTKGKESKPKTDKKGNGATGSSSSTTTKKEAGGSTSKTATKEKGKDTDAVSNKDKQSTTTTKKDKESTSPKSSAKGKDTNGTKKDKDAGTPANTGQKKDKETVGSGDGSTGKEKEKDDKATKKGGDGDTNLDSRKADLDTKKQERKQQKAELQEKKKQRKLEEKERKEELKQQQTDQISNMSPEIDGGSGGESMGVSPIVPQAPQSGIPPQPGQLPLPPPGVPPMTPGPLPPDNLPPPVNQDSGGREPDIFDDGFGDMDAITERQDELEGRVEGLERSIGETGNPGGILEEQTSLPVESKKSDDLEMQFFDYF